MNWEKFIVLCAWPGMIAFGVLAWWGAYELAVWVFR